MFERYTEMARRVIFFARYEASQFGASTIEPEHLLLGLSREDKPLFARFLTDGKQSLEFIRGQIEQRRVTRERIPCSVELPLAEETKRALFNAHEEGERLGDRHIGTEHLLLGLLRPSATKRRSITTFITLQISFMNIPISTLLRCSAHSTAFAAMCKTT